MDKVLIDGGSGFNVLFTKTVKKMKLMAVRVQIEVLNSVVPEEALEEITSRKRKSALHETREHGDLVFSLLHWVWISGGGPPHINLLLPDKSAVEKGQ
jgi:hypothetical protein